MSKYNKDAFVVMAQCETTKESFGVTFNPISQNLFRMMWAFKIKKNVAKKDKYDIKSVSGKIDVDTNFNGCPYCGSQIFYFCGSCGKMVCCDEYSEIVTCPNCGNASRLQVSDNFNIKGGGF